MLRLGNLDSLPLAVVHRADKNLRVTVRLAEMRRNSELLSMAVSVNNLNPDAAAVHVVACLDTLIRLLKCAKSRMDKSNVITRCWLKEPKRRNRCGRENSNNDELLAHGCECA